VVRPPTVRRSMGAPSRGQQLPGRRTSMWSPVCEPPRRPSVRSVVEIARASFRRSSASRLAADRAGSSPARNSASSVSRLPSPARKPGDPGLVHQHRLDRSTRAGEHGLEVAQPQRERVDAEAILVGIELDGAEPAGIAQVQGSSVGEAQTEAAPLGVVTVRGVQERVAGGLPVDHDPTAHPEMHRERWAGLVGVDEQQLPAPAGVDEPPPRQSVASHERRESSLEEPGVGRVHRDDLTPERALSDEDTGGLRLQDLRHPHSPISARCGPLCGPHRAENAQTLVMAPFSAPCARRAYLARNPLG